MPCHPAPGSTPRERAARRAARRGSASGPTLRVAAVVLAAAVVPAQGGDRSLGGSISQSFIADSNVDIEADDGASVGSITRLGLSYTDRTPSAVLSLSTGLSYSAFSNDENSDISGLFPRLNGSYTVFRPTRSLSVGFNASIIPQNFNRNVGLVLNPFPDPVDPIDPDDPDPDDPDPDDPDPVDPDAPDDGGAGLTRNTGDALRISYGVNVGYSQRLGGEQSLSFGARAARTDFIDNEGTSLTPNTNLGLNAGWNRQLSARGSVGVSASAGYFQAETDGRPLVFDEERQTFTVSIGPTGSYNRTARERYTLSFGPAFNYSSFETPAGGRDSETSVSLRGSAGFAYVTPMQSYSLTLSQSAVPQDSGGSLVNRSSLAFSTSRRVSATSNVNARAGLGFQTALTGDDADVDDRLDGFAGLGFSQRVDPRNGYNLGATVRFDDEDGDIETTTGLTAGWNHQLTREVSANLGYSFRFRTSDGNDDLTSHRLQLTFSRPFALLR